MVAVRTKETSILVNEVENALNHLNQIIQFHNNEQCPTHKFTLFITSIKTNVTH